MKWETVRLGDIIDFSNGINFDKSAYTQGIKIVGVSDFGNLFSPNYDELSEVKSDIVKSKDLLKNGDIVFVRSNGNKELVGRCMLVKKLPYPVTYSGFCIRARINSPNSYNSVFLTYYFKSMFFRKLLSGSSVGANIQNLSQARLSNCTISIPHIQTQKRIAGILSAYDDLIENNQKQIKLLEEAAQRLYKEWFVDLRFPDHEHTAIVDGVPEGWRKGRIEDIAIFKRGKTITKSQVNDGIIPVVAGGLEPAYFHNQANTVAPVITISGSGANAGYTRIYFEDVFASDCSFADSKTTNNLYFIYCFLKASKESIDALQKGSAQPHVYAKDINAMDLLIPTNDVFERFNQLSVNVFGKIGILQKQNKELIQARDRLLPKLMSGEMEVI